MGLRAKPANAVIELLLRTTTVQVSLHSGDPGTDGTANELTDPAYTRKTITFAAPVDGTTSNDADVLWPAMDGTVSHIGLWDSDGDLIISQSLTASKTLAGDEFKLPTGGVTFDATRDAVPEA